MLTCGGRGEASRENGYDSYFGLKVLVICMFLLLRHTAVLNDCAIFIHSMPHNFLCFHLYVALIAIGKKNINVPIELD
jgi:hypothetical protein